MIYNVEEFEGRAVIVLYKSEKILTLVRSPGETAIGDVWDGEIDGWDEEGPYCVLDGQTTGHEQRLVETYLLHPGKTIDEALDEMGLDDESLIPRY